MTVRVKPAEGCYRAPQSNSLCWMDSSSTCRFFELRAPGIGNLFLLFISASYFPYCFTFRSTCSSPIQGKGTHVFERDVSSILTAFNMERIASLELSPCIGIFIHRASCVCKPTPTISSSTSNFDDVTAMLTARERETMKLLRLCLTPSGALKKRPGRVLYRSWYMKWQ